MKEGILMMKATPRASFMFGVESDLSDEKADEIAKIVKSLVKGMTDSQVKVTFTRHYTFHDEPRLSPFAY